MHYGVLRPQLLRPGMIPVLHQMVDGLSRPATFLDVGMLQMGNKGALVKIDAEGKPSFLQFTAVPHPPVKPMAYAPGMGMFGL